MAVLLADKLVDKTRRDPLRRLKLTPFAVNLPIMGRTVRLETNSSLVLERTRVLFARYREATASEAEFLWRIVCDDSRPMAPPWPEISAFSDHGLRFVNIGQSSFLAVDLEAREAVGYLAEGLLQDELGFVSPFLYTLFCLTAGALRLTSLSAACVTKGKQGLLVLGPPNNGKTTSSYLATKLGLEFYADRAVSLDLYEGELRVWGDFSPAAFRVDTCQFLPELGSLGRPFHYRDLNFLYVEKGTSVSSNGHPVIPAACVFLERRVTAVPQLSGIDRSDFCERLKQSLPFKDDERFEAQESAALSALGRVPAYHLAYGDDPATAAAYFPSLLAREDLRGPER